MAGYLMDEHSVCESCESISELGILAMEEAILTDQQVISLRHLVLALLQQPLVETAMDLRAIPLELLRRALTHPKPLVRPAVLPDPLNRPVTVMHRDSLIEGAIYSLDEAHQINHLDLGVSYLRLLSELIAVPEIEQSLQDVGVDVPRLVLMIDEHLDQP